MSAYSDTASWTSFNVEWGRFAVDALQIPNTDFELNGVDDTADFFRGVDPVTGVSPGCHAYNQPAGFFPAAYCLSYSSAVSPPAVPSLGPVAVGVLAILLGAAAHRKL